MLPPSLATPRLATVALLSRKIHSDWYLSCSAEGVVIKSGPRSGCIAAAGRDWAWGMGIRSCLVGWGVSVEEEGSGCM